MSELTTYPQMEQRSEEWFAARCGLVTASAVGRLIGIGAPGPLEYGCLDCQVDAGQPCISKARKAGAPGAPIKTVHPARTQAAADFAPTAPPVLSVADNDTSRGLLTTLAAERITGHVEETPVTGDMIRGIEHEPFARDAYVEHRAPADVTEVGFMVRDYGAFKIGLSPDGLVGEDGLLEIKCPRAKGHINTILSDEVPSIYMAQCQTALLVSGRSWLHFVSFVGGMPLYTKRVTPDPLWQAAILAATDHAETAIADITSRYQAAVKGLPATERVLDLTDTIIF